MRRDRLLRGQIHTRFLVTLVDGTGLSGLLVDIDEHVLALAAVTYLPRDPKAQPITVDGLLYIERPKVAYLQAP